MTTSIRGSAVLLAALALAGPASATMYRCGNVFQDRPCDAGVQTQVITPGKRSPEAAPQAPAVAASPHAAQCARVGEHAQRITWKREGGATMEQQINEARGDQGMIALIEAVYARRGPAPQVRSAMEAECVAERERQAAAAEALGALKKQAGAQPLGPSEAAPAAASAADLARQPVAAKDASRCNNLKARHRSVEAQMRSGGSAVTMEHWQNQRRDLERQLSEARC